MPKIPNPDSTAPIKPYRPEATGTNIEHFSKAAEFIKLKNETTANEKRMKVLKEELSVLLAGEVPDPSGHRTLVLKHGTNAIELKQTLRTTVSVRPDALTVLQKNKLDKAIETVDIVRTDVLEIMVQEGEVPEKLYDEIFASKENYAFTAKVTSVTKPRSKRDADE